MCLEVIFFGFHVFGIDFVDLGFTGIECVLGSEFFGFLVLTLLTWVLLVSTFLGLGFTGIDCVLGSEFSDFRF